MLHFVINFKNYVEASKNFSRELARSANIVSEELIRRKAEVEIIIAVPAFSLGLLSREFKKLPIFAQHLDSEPSGSTTGFLVPEIAKLFGAAGTILNHSEHRIPESEISKVVEGVRKLGMRSLVCARDNPEVERLAVYQPDFLAIEPPELIGSGISVSKARPEIITESREILERVLPKGSKTVLLCGAGISEPIDAQKSIELGSRGILVASGVVKDLDWKAKIRSLSEGLIATRASDSRRRPKKEGH